MIEELMKTYNKCISLRDAIITLLDNTPKESSGRYSNYRSFAKQYTQLAREALQNIKISNIELYDENPIPRIAYDSYREQKNYFETVYMNLSILISSLENNLDVKQNEILKIKDFLETNLRKAIHDTPKHEKTIQNAVENLLIGRGYTKGIDYDRETGRVKVSIKEAVPDFIFKKIGLALEIKFSTTKLKSKQIVDEINADIKAYNKEYSNLLFLIYDIGTIRDESEFKNDIDNKTDILVIIVKH